MDYSIKNTTKKQRAEVVKKALTISLSGADMPTDETLKLTRKYIDGELELKDLQKQIVNKYKK